MQFLQMSIYVVVYLCMFFSNVYCDCEKNNGFSSVISPTSELKTIDSFFYMSTKGHLTSPVRERKKNNQSSTSQPCNCTKPDEQDSQDAAFYKRLIAIIISNLMMQKVNEKYTGILNIEVSSLDFEYMQKFVDGQGSIREIDRILKNTIKRSETSICNYMIEASHCFNSFLDKTLMLYIYCKSWIIDHWDVIIIAFTVLFSFIILWRKRWSRSLFIFLTIDVIFIISFFITWWRLIEEAEIKLTAAQAQFAEMPITCQPHKMGLWDKAIAWLFSTNDCEKYYETIMANPKLQVTPAFALTYFLSMTIFQPLSCFGLIISEFIDNATGKLNFICKFPITIALFLSICVGIILIPLSWIGGSINFGLGPFFKFGLKGRQSYNDQEERIERIREAVLSRKKLKDSKKMKLIVLKQDNDLAGGDANVQHVIEKYTKYQCENDNANKDVKCVKKEEIDR